MKYSLLTNISVKKGKTKAMHKCWITPNKLECPCVMRLAGIPSLASGSVWLTSTMSSLFSTPASTLYLLLGGQEIQGRTCLVCQEVLLPSREKDIDLAGKTEICSVFKYVFGSVYTIKKTMFQA